MTITALKNQSRQGDNNADPRPTSALETDNQLWKRQPGESTLWYNRFLTYRKLGPKRSLQAAVAQERTQITALKSPTEPKKQGRGKTTKKREQGPTIAPVAQKTQVPGSWKQASIRWRWVERASAYDIYVVEKTVNETLEKFGHGLPVLPADRIRRLDTMYEVCRDALNNMKHTTLDDLDKFIARMQSLIRDIREEMKLHDKELARIVQRARTSITYREESQKKVDALK